MISWGWWATPLRIDRRTPCTLHRSYLSGATVTIDDVLPSVKHKEFDNGKRVIGKKLLPSWKETPWWRNVVARSLGATFPSQGRAALTEDGYTDKISAPFVGSQT